MLSQVNVQMEYSRKVGTADVPAAASGSADSRIMDFGSVFLLSPIKGESDDAAPASSTPGSQQAGVNIAELVIARGFGTVIRHRDFEERSNYYDALLAAESRAVAGKKGIHSARDPPVMHITDLLTVSDTTNKWIKFFLQFRNIFCSSFVNSSFFRHQPRKQKISCHSCIGVGRFLLSWNMSSVGIALNY